MTNYTSPSRRLGYIIPSDQTKDIHSFLVRNKFIDSMGYVQEKTSQILLELLKEKYNMPNQPSSPLLKNIYTFFPENHDFLLDIIIEGYLGRKSFSTVLSKESVGGNAVESKLAINIYCDCHGIIRQIGNSQHLTSELQILLRKDRIKLATSLINTPTLYSSQPSQKSMFDSLVFHSHWTKTASDCISDVIKTIQNNHEK